MLIVRSSNTHPNMPEDDEKPNQSTQAPTSIKKMEGTLSKQDALKKNKQRLPKNGKLIPLKAKKTKNERPIYLPLLNISKAQIAGQKIINDGKENEITQKQNINKKHTIFKRHSRNKRKNKA